MSLSCQTSSLRGESTSNPGPLQLQAINDIVAELQEYGLTRNEARVLVFLAKTGPSKASEVARAIQINRTETYRTIRNLQRRGLVEATLERPVRFQSGPFEKCLQVLIDERKARLRILEQRGENLRRQFEVIRVETELRTNWSDFRWLKAEYGLSNDFKACTRKCENRF